MMIYHSDKVSLSGIDVFLNKYFTSNNINKDDKKSSIILPEYKKGIFSIILMGGNIYRHQNFDYKILIPGLECTYTKEYRGNMYSTYYTILSSIGTPVSGNQTPNLIYYTWECPNEILFNYLIMKIIKQ